MTHPQRVRIATAAGLAFCALALTACKAGPAPAADPQQGIEDLTAGVTTTTQADSTYEMDTSEWTVDLKVTRKQCFASAGCNVTVQPKVAQSGYDSDAGIVP